MFIYGTAAQIVICTLSDESVLSESTGYLTRYSVPVNEISFEKKISQSDFVFQLKLG